MISKATALSLLRIVQSPVGREEFAASNVMREFVAEHGIGFISRNKAVFGAVHKERIRELLRAMNIDPNTDSDAWSGRSRAEALTIGPDEKWTDRKVRGGRIAIKVLPGQSLIIDDNPLSLPLGANLEWTVDDTLIRVKHSSVVCVENWEAFEAIDRLQIDFTPAGPNPLIIWRGAGQALNASAAYKFLSDYQRPVWSAPDYDPAGLLIATTLPHLAGVLSPTSDVLTARLTDCHLHQRYLDQLPGAQATLDTAPSSDIQRLWKIIRGHGKALPQESLIIGRGIA